MSTKDSPVEVPTPVSPEIPLSKTICSTLTPQTKKKQQSYCDKIKLVDWVQTTWKILKNLFYH